MSKLTVYDMKGAAVGETRIADDLLVVDKGEQAVHDTVLAYMAAQRTGTASTLRKGEVAGSNKKPWKQKGTGRARAGLRQSPVWRGGGVAFGPHPRDFSVKVNRKVGRLAFRRALSERISAGELKVVDSLAMAEPKTRLVAALIKALDINRGVLLIVDRLESSIVKACRNLARVEIVSATEVNVYQMLRYPAIVTDKAGLATLRKRLGAEGEGA
jgi:large subunit ribosomal protein L4